MSRKEKETEELCGRLEALVKQEKTSNFKQLQDIYEGIQNNFSSALNNFYKKVQYTPLKLKISLQP